MDKEISHIFYEIIFVIFIMIIGSYIYNYFSLCIMEKREAALRYENEVRHVVNDDDFEYNLIKTSSV